MADLPTVLTIAGLQPQSPATLRAELLASVAATNPGYTANLPGSLIEDVSSTEVGGLSLIDSFRVETVNSMTPFGANAFILNQLGAVYGVPLGLASNTSVFLIFSGTVNFLVPKGFTVSDGTNQYVVQDGGIIQSGGQTTQLFAVASQPGAFAVPPNSVTTLITSVPVGINLTVTNPLAGVPGDTAQTLTDYRAQVLQAGLAASTGMTRYLKTLLGNVPGVQNRLVSAQQQTGGGWKIIVGGGDPYAVADAIFMGLFDISTLVGSQINVTGITKANPGVVTTDLNHGLVTGQSNVHLAGVLGMTGANGGPYTVTVIDEKTFSFGVNTTGFGTYTGGGVVTPNNRNIVVSITDYPDTYSIPYVNPPQQTVTITLTWNTTATNLVSDTAVQQAGSTAIAAYVNSVGVGQPMNLFELETVFQVAVANLIPPQLLTRMIFAVSVNGVAVTPVSGTGILNGDPESYFLTNATAITVARG